MVQIGSNRKVNSVQNNRFTFNKPMMYIAARVYVIQGIYTSIQYFIKVFMSNNMLYVNTSDIS